MTAMLSRKLFRKARLFTILIAFVGVVDAHRHLHKTFPSFKKVDFTSEPKRTERREELAVHFTQTHELQDIQIPTSLLVQVIHSQDGKAYPRRKRKPFKRREAEYTDYGEDDFNPFSDVDETAAESSEYENIDHAGEMESTIKADKVHSNQQQTELNEIMTKEAELEDELNTAKKEATIEREKANLEHQKSSSFESRLIKELLLNQAEKKRRLEEINRRKTSEAKNMENIRKLIDLQNQLQQIKANLGHPDADCTISPCANGGVCLAKQPSGHECMCPQNYWGSYCQRRLPGQSNKSQFKGQGVLAVQGLPPMSEMKLAKQKIGPKTLVKKANALIRDKANRI